jgi:putative GTP pyrophosphokinase
VPVSKTQIDRLGDRLKGGSHTETDLRLLDDYRRSFGEPYDEVVRAIRQLGQLPTGRLAKSTRSIVEKLRRESVRLSQMQDIAGCRVVVQDIVEQDRVVEALRAAFADTSAIDRRETPSFGYRAVHIIASVSGKPVEVQVRSSLQHLWAELSEKASDVIDPAIKYGGGPNNWRYVQNELSALISIQEDMELVGLEPVGGHEAQEQREKLEKSRNEILGVLKRMIDLFDTSNF